MVKTVRRTPAVMIAFACSLLLAALGTGSFYAQTAGPSGLIASRSVNMVAGDKWPTGDPYLQRQNEPSVAASTRNPQHLLAGANDYRTVDMPGLPSETGDAWLGIFKSVDGGDRWQTNLLPGYPQDTSAEGLASPIHGFQAGADPVVRPGTNGLLYYAGLAFNRGENQPSAVFMSRFIDNNNTENGDPIKYLGTTVIDKSTGTDFIDKPWMAVDVPRAGAKSCRIVTSQPPPAELKNGVKWGRYSGWKKSEEQRRKREAEDAKKGKKPLPKPTTDPRMVAQSIEAGRIYVAYSRIKTVGTSIESRIMFSQSDDCGASWTKPVQLSSPADKVNQGANIAIDPSTGAVFVAWRQFGMTVTDTDSVMVARMPLPNKAFEGPNRVRKFNAHRANERLRRMIAEHQGADADDVAAIQPFDQGTAEDRFRTNAYPTIAVDDESRVYVAWTERGYGTARPNSVDPASKQAVPDGDARVVISSSKNGAAWTTPKAVDAGNGAAIGTPGADAPGHQLMPSITFAAGKLVVVYYDLREDVSRVFGPFISERDAVTTVHRRHTIDIRAAYALKGDVPVFGPSQQVSTYLEGNLRGSTTVGPLQANAPGLPLFKLGTVPFLGDYIDIAPSPAFVQNAKGAWGYNTSAQAAPVFHVVWTDNRDVQKPLDGDWTHYTPVGAPNSPGRDPGAGACVAGQAGMRNQNIYSARLTWGLVAGSPGNNKSLDPTMPRAFVVFAQNTTTAAKTFRFTISSQPAGGVASFTQTRVAGTAPLTSVDVTVAAKSMVTRTVFATSTDSRAQVPVDIREVAAPNSTVIAGGLASRVILNPEISNPEISNPEISNPEISNPEISNAEVYNPEISNPEISNPEISNPEISNPEISNPEISNIVIANPEISNPEISNPEISNPEISNPEISNPEISNSEIRNGAVSDVTWTIINTGNTTTSFNINLFLANAAAKLAGAGGTGVQGGIKTQLVVNKTYTTPIALGCSLKSELHRVLVANVPYPKFTEPGTSTAFDPANASVTNTTVWLEPGGEAKITLRIVDPNPTDNIRVDPVHDVTPVVTAEPKNTPDLSTPVLPPPSTTPPSTPDVTLAFTAQPTNTTVSGVIAPIAVHVQVGAAAGAGVQVTLAIASNPAGGHLSGTTTLLTDGAGNVTFTGLSIEKAGTGYRLSASASAAGAVPDLSVAFDIGSLVPPPMTPTAWTATGTGVVGLINNGLVGGTPQMTYQEHSAVFNGAWTFSTIATVAGAPRLDWEWTGFHSYCLAAVQLQAFVNRGGSDVYTSQLLGMSDDCVGARNPSAGFAFAGVTGVTVQAGDTYGFRIAGSHNDGTYVLDGTFGVVVNGATSASPLVVTNASDGGPGSLRAAIIAANGTPDVNTITFAIPGPWLHTIAPQTPLPLVTQPVVIDGLSQPGAASMAPTINIDGRYLKNYVSYPGDDALGTNIGKAPGFEVIASNVTIRGLGINRFPGPAVFLMNGTSNVHVEDSTIGAGPAGVPLWPNNNVGVWANYSDNNVIERNVISSSEGSGILLVGGAGTVIRGNRIGTSVDGLSALPNQDNGITMYGGTSGTVIDGNLISGNGFTGAVNGWGIDIQQSGGLASVVNTTITSNRIGLDLNGNILFGAGTQKGNSGGGVRINRAVGTVIGGSLTGNVISGNTGSGIAVLGPIVGVTSIVGNKIGSDPSGALPRGNGANGIYVETTASNVTMLSNVMFSNGGPGIALNGVANNSQAAPSLSVQGAQSPAGHTVVDVTLSSPAGTYMYEFFKGSSCGAAEQVVMSTSAGAGAQSIELNVGLPVGTWITATATDGLGNTSQLANCAQVPAPPVSATITSVSPASGKSGEGYLVVRGTNLPSGVSNVVALIASDAGTSTGDVHYGPSTASAVWVRLQGAALGPGTIQLKNTAGTIVSNAFPITVTANPGTPVITAIRDGGLDLVTSPLGAGAQIYVSADGIDTTGAVVRFTQGANIWDVTGSAASNSAIGLALLVSVPGAAAPGSIDVSVRQGSSAFSAAVTISIAAPPVTGEAGGGGGTPFGPILCPGGSVATALTGRAGDDIDQTSLWCSPVLAGPTLGAAQFAGGVGGGGGGDYGATLTCPSGSVMTGIHGRAGIVVWGGNVVDTLGVTCRDIATAAVFTSATVGNPSPSATPFAINCPAGQEVIGIEGGQGGLLDRIGIYCGNPVLPEPATSTVSPIQTFLAEPVEAEPAWFDPRRRLR